jgi:hypothetical protein
MRRAVLIVVVLVALASCSREGALSPATPPGGAASSSEPSAPTGDDEDPAKAAFVKAANAACRDYGADSDDLPDPEELDDYVPFMRGFIRIGDELQAKLRALPVPPADAKAIEGYLNSNDEQSHVLKEALPKIEAAARDDDVDAADEALSVALDEFNRISESQDPFARGYGLTDCANPVEDDGSSVEA